MNDNHPPTLDYSAPAREPVDPYEAILRTLALLAAIPAFLLGVVFTVFAFINLCDGRKIESQIPLAVQFALGLGGLYLTHRLAKFRRGSR
ncbi:hypothetical protein BH10PLA1_BH10PLA1_10160 [soil metagenome]